MIILAFACMISRRRFLKLGALTGASFLLPEFLKSFDSKAFLSDKKLVIIQLSGGNDGLNTVIPFRNDIYYSSRPTIAIRRQEVLQLNDEAGLHPSLLGFRALYEKDELSIINNVGYPNHSRSHFQSLNIWHTAHRLNDKIGWLGRYLDEHIKAQAFEIDETTSLAVKGKYRKGMVMPFDKKNSAQYPDTILGHRLHQTAKLINSDASAKLFYISHGSFDTHVAQKEHHKNLLTQLDESLHAFVTDLKKNRKFQDVLVLTFSEFGRRVAENEHQGTDHGAANNMFIISGGIKKPGLYNELPTLRELDEGDVRHEIDFRQVYATVLERWLNANAKSILGKDYQQLNFI